MRVYVLFLHSRAIFHKNAGELDAYISYIKCLRLDVTSRAL